MTIIDNEMLWHQFGAAIEMLGDALRHVQEHAAQLHMFLGQQAGKSAEWISQAQ